MADKSNQEDITGMRRNERPTYVGPPSVPPGATRKAFDREDPGGGPAGSPLGDRHAAGDPAGGDSTGGLAGSNIDDGSPVLEPEEELDAAESQPPYAGHAGGAVGGSPAQGRSSGGNIHGGLAPGGSHRGDSTIGSKRKG